MKHLDRSQIYWIELSCCPEPVGYIAAQGGYSGKDGEANRVVKCWANGEKSRDKQGLMIASSWRHLPRKLVLHRVTFSLIWVLCNPVVHVCVTHNIDTETMHSCYLICTSNYVSFLYTHTRKTIECPSTGHAVCCREMGVYHMEQRGQ